MSSLDTRLVRRHFSAHAGDYDRYALVQKRVAARLIARLLEGGLPEGLILDVGTGTGALAQVLSLQRPGVKLVISDLAHDMTRTARQRLPGALPCDADAVRLPFAAGAFAAVVSSSVYQWVAGLPAAFSEAARVLAPGGSLGVALFGAATLAELRGAHRQALADCGCPHVSHMQSFPSADEVAAALQAAGLSIRHLESYPDTDWHADVPTLLRRLKQIGADNAAAGRPRGLASRRVIERMIALYDQRHRRAEGVPASYEVVCALAVKG